MRYFLAFLAILYALIPYDILPDFAVGWGWIDDIIILWLLWHFFNAQRKKMMSSIQPQPTAKSGRIS